MFVLGVFVKRPVVQLERTQKKAILTNFLFAVGVPVRCLAPEDYFGVI